MLKCPKCTEEFERVGCEIEDEINKAIVESG